MSSGKKLFALSAALLVIAAAGVALWLLLDSEDEGILVARPESGSIEVGKGDVVRVSGTVRDADFSSATGSRDGIAFQTDSAVFADSISPAAASDAGTEPGDIDIESASARGEQVVVTGEVTQVSDDGRSFVIDLDD